MVKLLTPYLAFRGVALAEVSAWIGAWIMLMITLPDLSGKNGFFSVSLRRTSYLGAKLSIEI